MPSKAEQVAARIHALLLNATAAGAAVYRDRDDAFTREETPAILVECVDEDTATLGGAAGPVGHHAQTDVDDFRVSVIVCVRGAAWQTVADGVRVQAHALIVADATLRALVADLRRNRAQWAAKSADVPFGYLAQTYLVKYHTRARALDSGI